MNNEPKLTAEDWVRMNSSKTKIAEDLGLSRPTVIKYIQLYDDGKKDDIPDKAFVAYFDQRLTDPDSVEVLKVKLEIKQKIQSLNNKAEEIQVRMQILLKRSADLDRKIVELKSNISSDNVSDDKLQGVLIELDHAMAVRRSMQEEANQYNMKFQDIQDRISELSMKLSQYEASGLGFKSTAAINKAYGIQSRCFVDGGRCMVIHNGPHLEEGHYALHLYSVIDSEYINIGTYYTARGRNFFIIDDVVLSAPLYYDVTGYEVDPNGDIHDEDDFNITYSTSDKLTTGMCELKPRK